MALKVPNVGSVKLLDLLKLGWGQPRVKLYQNNVSLTSVTVIGDFTEATFNSYVGIDAVNWTTPGIDGNGRARTVADPLQWAKAAGGASNATVYGYYVIQVASGTLLWAEAFPGGPFPMVNLGDIITLSPRLTLVSEF